MLGHRDDLLFFNFKDRDLNPQYPDRCTGKSMYFIPWSAHSLVINRGCLSFRCFGSIQMNLGAQPATLRMRHYCSVFDDSRRVSIFASEDPSRREISRMASTEESRHRCCFIHLGICLRIANSPPDVIRRVKFEADVIEKSLLQTTLKNPNPAL